MTACVHQPSSIGQGAGYVMETSPTGNENRPFVNKCRTNEDMNRWANEFLKTKNKKTLSRVQESLLSG